MQQDTGQAPRNSGCCGNGGCFRYTVVCAVERGKYAVEERIPAAQLTRRYYGSGIAGRLRRHRRTGALAVYTETGSHGADVSVTPSPAANVMAAEKSGVKRNFKAITGVWRTVPSAPATRWCNSGPWSLSWQGAAHRNAPLHRTNASWRRARAVSMFFR